MARLTRIRTLWLILLSGLLAAASVQAEPVTLAVLLPLSNVYKNLGITAKEGLLLGIEEERAAHKADWRSWVTLTFHDTRVDKAHSLQQAKDAIAGGAKAILGCTTSEIGVALQDYALNEVGVPFIVFGGCVTDKLRTTHSLFIRTSFSSTLITRTLAHWLTEHPLAPGSKPRWACIHANRLFAVGMCDGFKRAYGQVGEEIGRVLVPPKTVNMHQELAQLEKLNPDFALAAFVGAEAEVLFRAYYRSKIHEKIPAVALAAAVTPRRLRAYEKTLDKYDTAVGLVSFSPYSAVLDDPINQEFVALMQRTYDKHPTPYAMWGYDAGRLLVKALAELQGQWDGAKVVQLMKTLPHRSPRHGQVLRFDTHGDVVQGGYIRKTKRDGHRLVNEVIGQVPPINMDEVLK